MAFKIADGYVEVHARHDRASTRRNAQQAVRDSDKVGKDNEGSLLRWLFKSNPKLMRLLEAPIGAIFSSPIVFAAAAAAAFGLVGFLASAVTTALLVGLAGGFIAAGAFFLQKNKELNVAWNETGDRIQSVFERAAQPILGPMIRGLDIIASGFERMEPSLNRIYTALAPLIEPFAGGLVGFLEAMLPGIERALPGISIAVIEFAKHLPGLGTALGDMFATLAENGPLVARIVGLFVTWLENFVKFSTGVIMFWLHGFAFWADRWNNFTHAINTGVDFIIEVWGKIPGWWDSTWGAVSGWFSGLWSDISGFFSDTGSSISTWWNNQVANITGWWASTWGAVTTWFSEMPDKISQFFSNLPQMLGDWFQQAFDRVFYLIGFSIGTWVRGFSLFLLEVLPGLFKDGWDFVNGIIESAWNWALTFVTSTLIDLAGRILMFFMNIDQYFAMGMSWIGGKLRQGFDNCVRQFNWVREQASRIIQAMWDGVIRIFNWGTREAPGQALEMARRVIQNLSDLGRRLYNSGQDAIRGLINGIGSMMGWAVSQAWNAAKRIAQGFIDALRIGSPSKLMEEEVGHWIPPGIAIGIEKNMGPLEKQAGLYSDLLTGARPTLGAGYGSADTYGRNEGTTIQSMSMVVQIDRIEDLEDIKRFLEGKLSGAKANSWAGNIFEKTGEYERSYR